MGPNVTNLVYPLFSSCARNCQIPFVSRHWCDLNFYFSYLRITWYENKYKDRSKCPILLMTKSLQFKKHWVLSAILQESLWIWWRSQGLKGERKKLKLTVCSKISCHASNTIACLAVREDSHQQRVGHNGVCGGPHEQRNPPYLITAYTYVF